VRDNGHGFDPTRTREGGNGLHNFRKRAEELGGTLTLESTSAGTMVALHVPVTPTNMEAKH
jgi:signal transduction histidine kinase